MTVPVAMRRLFTVLILAVLATPCTAVAQDAARPDGGRQGEGRGGRGGRMFGPMGRSLDSVTEMREQFQPAVERGDLGLMREGLGLDPQQLTVVETVVEGYGDRFAAASEQAQQVQRDLMRQMFQSFMGGNMRERFQESFQKIQSDLEQMAVEAGGELPLEMRRQYFREQMQRMSEEIQRERETDGSAAETRRIAGEMVKAADAWRKERTSMESEVMESVRAVLHGEQSLRWPGFERTLRRERSLGRGRLSGESVDLLGVVKEARLSPEGLAAVQAIMDDYETRLDDALRRRNDYLAQNEVKALRAIQEGDARAMEQLAERLIALRNSVRAVHDEARTAVVAALPADEGKRVEQAAMRAAFGRVYRPTRADRSFDTALGLADLTAEQRQAVDDLRSLYDIEVDASNRRITDSIRRAEPDRLVQEAVRASGLLNGGSRFFDGPPEDPADALFEKRGDLIDGYVKRLADLLTPEQAEKLPKGTGRDEGRRQGPFGSWTIADMSEDVRAAAKAADKDGNGVLEGDERREFMRSLRGPDGEGGPGGQGGPGGRGGRGGGGLTS